MSDKSPHWPGADGKPGVSFGPKSLPENEDEKTDGPDEAEKSTKKSATPRLDAAASREKATEKTAQSPTVKDRPSQELAIPGQSAKAKPVEKQDRAARTKLDPRVPPRPFRKRNRLANLPRGPLGQCRTRPGLPYPAPRPGDQHRKVWVRVWVRALLPHRPRPLPGPPPPRLPRQVTRLLGTSRTNPKEGCRRSVRRVVPARPGCASPA